jgi:hypothetical protein
MSGSSIARASLFRKLNFANPEKVAELVGRVVATRIQPLERHRSAYIFVSAQILVPFKRRCSEKVVNSTKSGHVQIAIGCDRAEVLAYLLICELAEVHDCESVIGATFVEVAAPQSRRR